MWAPEIRDETGLSSQLLAHDPEVAKQFTRVTFLSDNRCHFPHIHLPTLILQGSEDVIAPEWVG